MKTDGRSISVIPAVFVVLLLAGGGIPGVAQVYPVVDTGQVTCYDATDEITCPTEGQAYFGQDAQYDGNQPWFSISGDGLTVHDNITGLSWIQSPDTDGDGNIDTNDKVSWANLPSYVAGLNADNYGGFDDWRVPSIKELYSLIDFRGTDPSPEVTDPDDLTPFIDTDYFAFGWGDVAAGERIIDAQYWSSTEYVSTTMGGDPTVFGVNFADGRIKGYPRDSGPGGVQTQYIRCVRGNTDYGINDYTDNADGTVTDSATGLMWMQSDSGSGMQWEDALAYAEGLELAGHDDWRLPNAKELQSIIDYTRSPDTSDSPAIDPVFVCTEISNETLTTDYAFYWTGTTHASATPGMEGKAAAYLCFGRGMGCMFETWMDVHGAGCQRSDPKDGDLSDYTYLPYGYYRGGAPQGDAIRLFNYVRCVRDDVDLTGAFILTGPGPGYDNLPLVRAIPPEQDAVHSSQFSAYAAEHYGVNVASGDVDRDLLDEVLTGAGPGDIYGPHVRGFQIDGTPLEGLSFLAYGTAKYGVNVATGDLDGDGYDEIITGAGPGAVFGPHVRAFNYDGTPGVTPVSGVSYFAYGTPKWGVNVAGGDIDGDGYDEIITGAGPGAVYGPHVRGWNIDGGAAASISAASFLAYGTNKFGVNVTCGDLDGDGIDEIVTGAGPGSVFGAHVRGWNYDGSALESMSGINFFAWPADDARYGVKVFAGTDLDDDGRSELVVGPGPDPEMASPVRVYQYDGSQVDLLLSLQAYPDGWTEGVSVAAGRF